MICDKILRAGQNPVGMQQLKPGIYFSIMKAGGISSFKYQTVKTTGKPLFNRLLYTLTTIIL
jgi:hypothetical protein